METFENKILEALKRRREPLCIHEISTETGIKEKNVSGLLYALTDDGRVIKCNEGQKAPCKWFGSNHFSWTYANKEGIEAKRSDEVGRMLRADHEKELKKLKVQHIDEINDLKTALNIARTPRKTDDVEVWKQKTRILAHMLQVVLEELKLN
jgi:transcription initiation factor IIE alpha subunit